MFNLTRKGLWAHKVRFVLTGLAVVLGVAFMAGTMILTDTMGKTFDGLFATANEGIDVVVHRTTGVDSDRRHRRPGASRRVARRRRSARSTASPPPPAPSRASPSSCRPTARARLRATASAAPSARSWIDDERLNPFALSAGRAPEADTEVVLDQATVEDEGWALGDTVGVLAKDATDRHDHRRHGHLRRRRGHPRLHPRRRRRRHRAGDVRPARQLRRHRGRPPTARRPTTSWPPPIEAARRLRRPRGHHRRGRHRRQAGRRSRRT